MVCGNTVGRATVNAAIVKLGKVFHKLFESIINRRSIHFPCVSNSLVVGPNRTASIRISKFQRFVLDTIQVFYPIGSSVLSNQIYVGNSPLFPLVSYFCFMVFRICFVVSRYARLIFYSPFLCLRTVFQFMLHPAFQDRSPKCFSLFVLFSSHWNNYSTEIYQEYNHIRG